MTYKVLDRQFFPADTLIIKQGTTGNRAFLIESGRVEVFAEQEDGSTVTLAQLGPQSIIGEMAAISDGPRTASVRALEDTTLVAISAREVRGSMMKSDNLFKRLTGIAADRLRETQDRLLSHGKKAEPVTSPAPAPAVPDTGGLTDGMTLTKQEVPAGTLIITEGSLTTDAFLIERGRVEVFTTDAAGHEIKIKELGPKSVVGEMAALTRKPRNASVRTLEDCTLIVVAARQLEERMEKSGTLRHDLMHMISTRLNDLRLKRHGAGDDAPDKH